MAGNMGYDTHLIKTKIGLPIKHRKSQSYADEWCGSSRPQPIPAKPLGERKLQPFDTLSRWLAAHAEE